MEIVFAGRAHEDLDYWRKSGDAVALKKIRKLLESIQQTPFEGIGKPEPLKHSLTGLWSRRITQEHRLVYPVEKDKIIVLQARFQFVSKAKVHPQFYSGGSTNSAKKIANPISEVSDFV